MANDDKKKELDLNDLDKVAGGYILDLGEGVIDSNRYAVIEDETGDVVCFTNTLRGAQMTCHGFPAGLGDFYNDEIISPDQYEKIYGKSFDGNWHFKRNS